MLGQSSNTNKEQSGEGGRKVLCEVLCGLLALLIFLGLTLLFLFLISDPRISYRAIALLLVLVSFYGLYKAYQRWRDLLIDNVVTWATIGLFIISVFTLALWFLVTFQWAAQDTQAQLPQTREWDYTFNSGVYRLLLSAPGAVRQGDSPATIALSVLDQKGITTDEVKFDAVLKLPQGLQMANDPITQTLTLSPEALSSQVEWQVLNAKEVNDTQEELPIIVSLVPQDLSTNPAPFEDTFKILAEGTWRFKIRRFINTAVDEATPLILFLALALPALGAISQRLLNDYREKEKARKAETEREEAERVEDLKARWRETFLSKKGDEIYARLAEIDDYLEANTGKKYLPDLQADYELGAHLLVLARLKPLTEIKQSITKVKRELRSNDRDSSEVPDRNATSQEEVFESDTDSEANSSLVPEESTVSPEEEPESDGDSDLHPPAVPDKDATPSEETPESNDDSDTNSSTAPDRERANYSNPKLSDEEKKAVLGQSKLWPEGFAEAFLQAHGLISTTGGQSDDFMDLYREARWELDYLDIADKPNLQAQLNKAHAEDVLDKRYVEDLYEPPSPPPEPVSWTVFERQPASTPFQHDDALQEEEELFLRRGGFWAGHPTFRKLRVTQNSAVIYGPSGCGLTAFARMIPFRYDYGDPESTLFVKLHPGSDFLKIGDRLTEQLLNRVLADPEYLVRLQYRQRYLVANVMCQRMGAQAALSSIATAEMSLRSAWSGETPVGEFQKRRLIREELQLALLGYAITRLNADDLQMADIGRDVTGQEPAAASILSASNAELLKAFGIERTVFVVDISSGHHRRLWHWLKSTILDRLDEWHEVGIRFFLFWSEDNSRLASKLSSYRAITIEPLRWDAAQLREMAETRYASVSPKRARFAQRFEKGSSAMDRLLDACQLQGGNHNPRQFIRLWKAIVQDKRLVDIQITEADVEKVAKVTGAD